MRQRCSRICSAEEKNYKTRKVCKVKHSHLTIFILDVFPCVYSGSRVRTWCRNISVLNLISCCIHIGRFRRRLGGCCRTCASVFISLILIASILCVLVLGWFSLRLKRDLNALHNRLSEGKTKGLDFINQINIRLEVHVFRITDECVSSVTYNIWRQL